MQAVQRAGTPFDLLISDVILPGIPGPKLAATLRKSGSVRSVLFISGYAATALGRRGIAFDELTLLMKPFDSRTLLERVRAVLDSVPSDVADARQGQHDSP